MTDALDIGKLSSEKRRPALISDRKRRVIHPVVHCHTEHIFPRLYFVVNLHLKRKESALMGTDLLPVQVYLCRMGNRTKPKNDSFLKDRPWDFKFFLIKRPAIMVSVLRFFFLIIVGSRNRQKFRIRKRLFHPLLRKSGSVIQLKLPDS